MTRYEAAIWRFQLDNDDITRRTLEALDRLMAGERPGNLPGKSAGGIGPMLTASAQCRFEFLEHKGLTPEGGGAFIAYGSSWDVDSQNERILPGAFSASIAASEGTVPLLFNHDRNAIVGLASSLSEDGFGLSFSGRLSRTQKGREVRSLLEIGALNSFSIGFTVPPGADQMRNGVRLISRIDLKEVSVVCFPANVNARIVPGTLQ